MVNVQYGTLCVSIFNKKLCPFQYLSVSKLHRVSASFSSSFEDDMPNLILFLNLETDQIDLIKIRSLF